MCNTRYKSCVNRYKQNSIYITCVIQGISNVSIDISRDSIYITCVIQDKSNVSIDI